MLDVNILNKYGLDTGLEHDFSMKHGSLMLFGHPVETNLNDLLPAHSNGRTCGGGWPQLWQQALLASVASPIWDSMFYKIIFPMLIAIKIGAHPSFWHQPKYHLVDSTSINQSKKKHPISHHIPPKPPFFPYFLQPKVPNFIPAITGISGSTRPTARSNGDGPGCARSKAGDAAPERRGLRGDDDTPGWARSTTEGEGSGRLKDTWDRKTS